MNSDSPTPDDPRGTLRAGLVFCPHCKGWIEPRAEDSGQTVACPHCGGYFQMPEMLTLGITPTLDRAALPVFPAPREPWYYGFIDTYAKVWMGLSLLLFALQVVGAIAFCRQVTFGYPAGNAWIEIGVPLMIVVVSIPTLLGIVLTVAFMRLALDMARNLRAIRQRDSR